MPLQLGAQRGIRTLTLFRAHGPQPCVSAVSPPEQLETKKGVEPLAGLLVRVLYTNSLHPEPAHRLDTCISFMHLGLGGLGGNRTLTPQGNQILNLARLPISPRGQLVLRAGFEPASIRTQLGYLTTLKRPRKLSPFNLGLAVPRLSFSPSEQFGGG